MKRLMPPDWRERWWNEDDTSVVFDFVVLTIILSLIISVLCTALLTLFLLLLLPIIYAV